MASVDPTPIVPAARPSPVVRTRAPGGWSFLGASVFVHLALPLAALLLITRSPSPAPPSPHGQSPERLLAVDLSSGAEPRPAPADEALPQDPAPRREAGEPAEPASPADVPVTLAPRPAPPDRPKPATPREPSPKPRSEPKRAPASGPRAAEVRRAQARSEQDWLSVDDQLDEPQGSAPGARSSAPSPDPLIERLLAAEARKAREHAPPADPSPRPAASALAAPAPPSAGVETVAAARGNTNLPVALARGLSEQIPVDPRWERAPLGRASAELVVQLHGGRIVEHRIGSTSSPELERSLSSALFVLERRRFDGGEIHPPDATLRLRVEISVRELSEGSAPGRPPFIQHRTGPSGEYLPRARIILPSLRQIEIEVLKRSS